MSTEVVNVVKRYGSLAALDGVSLTVEDGEFVAILGPSGCGKTTLLRIVAGFDTPTEGEIKIDGVTVAREGFVLPTERRNLGMVFQSFALWPHMNVAKHVRFPLDHQRRMSREEKENRIAEVLRIIGLEDMSRRMPHELSGGQRQRVALARAIASRPALLLMDEPLSSLDAALRDDMRREIQNVHRATEASVIYVTHDQNEALAMADRVVVMREGRVEQIAQPEELFVHPRSDFVARFVGKANLVEGTWIGESFRPKSAASDVTWDGSGTAAHFRQTERFPVRPEQFEIVKGAGESGVVGVVENVLFQGRDVQYIVKVEGESWQVYSSGGPRVELGERVTLRLRE